MQFQADVHDALGLLQVADPEPRVCSLVSIWSQRRPSSTHASAEAILCQTAARELLLRAVGNLRGPGGAPIAEEIRDAQAKVCLQVPELRDLSWSHC